MTGDLGSGAGRERSRPSFLPPVDGYPPPGDAASDPVPGEAPGPPRRGAPWIFATIVAAAALLVSAFLPWAHAQMVIQLFGRPIARDLGSLAGIDADTMIVAVPVLAVVAIALACWDLIGRDARIGALAAIPGTLALLVCGIFVLRLGDVRDNLPQTGLDFGYQITVRYGWYLAVLTSLLVVGFSLARPIAERVSRPRRGQDEIPQRHADRHASMEEPQYADQRYWDGQYPEDPYAAWPQEDQAWGRQAEEESPRSTDEPRNG
ncbi:hypothetical protein E1281_36485 [Actinomadura sp. KC345]|uniref:hypothetical protein n=1 Tax=Actinomadura sp. KC345 TaxID=2530371 RepID=UPI0010461752|nr:hypothetical protein [Actinomadura sp. KC345]TDC42249.1 hypothetical protein E1281_36485 [Actinomadura sp. KC345]